MEKETDEEQASAKRPYEAPAIISEEVFETLALSCAKITGNFKCITGGSQQS